MQLFTQILDGASVLKIDAQVAIRRFNCSWALPAKTAEVCYKDPYLIHVKLELTAFKTLPKAMTLHMSFMLSSLSCESLSSQD